jgi:hypothetical protein
MTRTDSVSLPYEELQAAAEAAPMPGDLNDQLVATSLWTDQMVADAGIPVVDVPIVSVGGGIGSFVLADYLRIAGLPPEQFKALGALDNPWDTYEYLTRCSQIPRPERLRSDSGSCPDNIWGFPSYALREAMAAPGIVKKLDPLYNVATEPIVTNYFTPRAGQVFEALAVEARRIGYDQMHAKGIVRMVRKRHGGGYFTILTPPAGTSATKRVAYRSTYVHVAVGYPGLRFLPDLQEYRTTHQDYHRVVNAYEPHEHVYEELAAKPGTVMVRGAGIVASRILQRLCDDRAKGSQIQIIHLFRTYVDSAHGPSIFLRRPGGNGWAYQGFNYPKSCWGGQYKHNLERWPDEKRSQLWDVMGGTTTPHRKLWKNQLKKGRSEGWYREMIGTVDSVTPGADGTVVSRINTDQGTYEVPANYIIDATGLEADITEHRVLADLLEHSGVGRNIKGKLDVERHFEIRGAGSAPGKMYASGSATLGAYFAVVDSFLGLQYAALRIADDLADQGFVPRITVGKSISGWRRWHKKTAP